MKKGYLSGFSMNQNPLAWVCAAALLCLTAFTVQAQSNSSVIVTAPAGAELTLPSQQAVFGPGITDPVSAPVIAAEDGSGTNTACVALTNDMTGAIALIDRGTCPFVTKVQNAQAAGAVGVILCNTEFAAADGVYQPYKGIVAGGDDMGTVTIPTVGLPYELCQILRANLGNGLEVTLSPDGVASLAGEVCATAVPIGPGTHSVGDMISGYGAVFTNGSNAAWFAYTPTTSNLATVSSCDQVNNDTRLVVMTGACDALVVVADNDDCDPDNNLFGSETSFVAEAGITYYIYWDDRWDFNGFDFTLTEGALPDVTVTFNVNMANESVSGDGVFMTYAGPGATIDDVEIIPMDDTDGDGVWSGSAVFTALETIGYAFINGDVFAGGTIESVPNDCGVDSGFGFNVRPLIIGGTDASIPVVCFSTCLGFCPEVGCAQTPTIMENLDGYSLGVVGPQSAVWTTWSGTEGGAEEGLVSDEQAFSAPNSLKIQGQNGPVDCLLLLGNETEGNWVIKFKMYIPSGSFGYYNIQDDETAGIQWNLEVNFDNGGTGTTADGASFTFPHDVWFDVVHRIDLDNDDAALIINGVLVQDWVFGPDWKIGSFDFFPNNNGPNLYYVDDIEMRPLEACQDGAIICDGFEEYLPSEISAQSSDWAPWTSSPADDGVVTGEQAYEGCQSLKISEDNPDDQLLLLGDRTSGNYLLEWQMYVPAGSLGYYNFQKIQGSPGSQFGMQVEWFADGTVTLDAGAADVVTFNWTPDVWSHFQHFIDLDNNWITLVVDGVEIYGWPASWTTFTQTGLQQIGSVDFFGNTGVLFYLDNVHFVQLPSVPGDACAGSIDLQGSLGQGLDNTVSSGPYDNTNYTTNSQDPTEGWECFGEPDGTGTAPSLERTMWFTFTGDGNSYFIEALACGDNPIGDSDTQMALYSGSCGALTPVACSEDGVNATTAYYPASFEVDLEAGVTYYLMVDGFGPDFEQVGEYCLEFTQLTAVLTTVTLNVDMNLILDNGGTVDPAGVHVAGSFQGWDPAATTMTDNGDGTWSHTFQAAPGTEIQYKFLNGNAWGTDEVNITAECGVDGGSGSFNRVLNVGTEDISTIFYCFDYCVTCLEVSVDETTLKTGINVFPNPAKDVLNVQFDLAAAADNLSLRMINTLGQVVKVERLGNYQIGTVEIDLSNLPAGTYMLQVADGKAQYTETIVVQ
ncbi:MAG TPA: T9SS type A sorting domain-containing protein [Saprospiraceae bacterium]|nr:T9SS type A sorting domain-containing protein [Saprospiraceae bacterium]HMQ81948.1 T9SS type A sorting domain-containing protein [Saprospiraceae bacterium]